MKEIDDMLKKLNNTCDTVDDSIKLITEACRLLLEIEKRHIEFSKIIVNSLNENKPSKK